MKYEITAPVFSSQISMYLISILLALIVIVLVSTTHYKLELTNEKVIIKSILYNTNIGYDKINLEGLRLVNLNEEGIKIYTRTNGIGLPGISIGWFSSGGKKYKLYLTNREKVLYIPKIFNYDILFSTDKGEEIIETIEKWNKVQNSNLSISIK